MMENIDAAKGLIATIIDEPIEFLEFQSKEKILTYKDKLSYSFMDFIAKIRNQDGTFKSVLIELQKTNTPSDLSRFRRYLGEQYRKEEDIINFQGSVIRTILPIITIYFLGFNLSKTLPAVIKVNRGYVDVLGGTEIAERNDFIERLTHDSYVIQIPRLKLKMKTRLEKVLSVFKQEDFIADDHHLKAYKYEIEDEVTQVLVKQLEKAAASRELLEQMELEELAQIAYEGSIGKLEKQLEEKYKALEEKNKAINEKDKVINEKDNVINEKDKAINEKDKAINEKDKAINEKDKAINEKDKVIEEQEKSIAENQKIMKEQAKILEDHQKQLEEQNKLIRELMEKLKAEK